MVAVSVSFDWDAARPIGLDERSSLAFPPAPAAPGLYRFDLTGHGGPSIYIGETDRLSRRFQHYRTPGPTQLTNLRLNQLMRDHLGAGGVITVCLATEARLVVDGQARELDFRVKPERRFAEAAALIAITGAGGIRVENL